MFVYWFRSQFFFFFFFFFLIDGERFLLLRVFFYFSDGVSCILIRLLLSNTSFDRIDSIFTCVNRKNFFKYMTTIYSQSIISLARPFSLSLSLSFFFCFAVSYLECVKERKDDDDDDDDVQIEHSFVFDCFACWTEKTNVKYSSSSFPIVHAHTPPMLVSLRVFLLRSFTYTLLLSPVFFSSLELSSPISHYM